MGGILAAIAAGPRPVEVPTIQDVQARNMQLQALAQQGMLRQQQMAESQQAMQLNAIKMQEAQYGLQDQQTMRNMLPKMMQDPKYQTDGQFDFEKALPDLPIDPRTSLGIQKIAVDNKKNHAETQKAIDDAILAKQNADEKAQDARVKAGDAFANDFLNWKAHGSNPAVWDVMLQNHQNQYPKDAAQVAAIQQQVANDPTQMDAIADRFGALLSPAGRKARAEATGEEAKAALAYDQETKRQYDILPKDPQTGLAYPEPFAQFVRSRNLTNAPATDTPQFAAGLARAAYTPDQRIQAMEADAMEQFARNPQQGKDQIHQLVGDNPVVEKSFQTEFDSAMRSGGPKAGAAVIAKAAQYNTGIQADIAKERALAPLRTTQAVATKVAEIRATTALAPDPFSDITDSGARNRAEAAYSKANDEVLNKVATSQSLRDTIDSYTHGNKAAAPIIPIETLRSYVNRVNRQELESVGHSGSFLDKLQGKIQGLTEGKPIPPDIIQGLDQLAQMQEDTARRLYQQKVAGIKATYGAGKLQPMNISEYQSPSVRNLPQGGGKTIDEATARQYKTAYGGDAAKARQAAIAAGWKIPQ